MTELSWLGQEPTFKIMTTPANADFVAWISNLSVATNPALFAEVGGGGGG